MKELEKIIEIMEKIDYGYLDESRENIFDKPDLGSMFSKIYHLMSPQELLDKKVGVCFDQVELERKLFRDAKINNDTFFIYLDNKKTLPAHTFLVFYDDKNFYWFEHAWFDYKGIHQYNSLEDLLNDVKIKFINSRKDEIDSKVDGYIYKYNKPNYNISCNQFYDYIFTQKKIITFKN